MTRQGIALRGHDKSGKSNNHGRHFIKMCNILCILYIHSMLFIYIIYIYYGAYNITKKLNNKNKR